MKLENEPVLDFTKRIYEDARDGLIGEADKVFMEFNLERLYSNWDLFESKNGERQRIMMRILNGIILEKGGKGLGLVFGMRGAPRLDVSGSERPGAGLCEAPAVEFSKDIDLVDFKAANLPTVFGKERRRRGASGMIYIDSETQGIGFAQPNWKLESTFGSIKTNSRFSEPARGVLTSMIWSLLGSPTKTLV